MCPVTVVVVVECICVPVSNVSEDWEGTDVEVSLGWDLLRVLYRLPPTGW